MKYKYVKYMMSLKLYFLHPSPAYDIFFVEEGWGKYSFCVPIVNNSFKNGLGSICHYVVEESLSYMKKYKRSFYKFKIKDTLKRH